MKKKNVLIISAAIVLFMVAIGMWYLAPLMFNNVDYPYYGHMIGGWMMPFGMIGMILFWGFIIYIVVKALQSQEDSRNNQSIENLKRRLAKGEITIEEYERLLSKIKED